METIASQCLKNTLSEYYEPTQVIKKFEELRSDNITFRAILKAMHVYRTEDLKNLVESLRKDTVDANEFKHLQRYRQQLFEFFFRHQNTPPQRVKKFTDTELIKKRIALYSVKILLAKNIL